MDMEVATTTTGAEVMAWISTYGYLILLPLFIIEGPIIGLTAGVLISLGALRPLPVLLLYVLGTTITDTVIYYSARGSVRHTGSTVVGRWVIRKVEDVLAHVDTRWKEGFTDNYTSLMILAKLAPINLLASFVAATAGMLQIPARRFYPPIIIAQPLWSAAVIGLGFYLGGTFRSPESFMANAGFITAVLLGALIIYYWHVHERIMNSQLVEFLHEKTREENESSSSK